MALDFNPNKQVKKALFLIQNFPSCLLPPASSEGQLTLNSTPVEAKNYQISFLSLPRPVKPGLGKFCCKLSVYSSFQPNLSK
jgi:hypothetical protein